MVLPLLLQIAGSAFAAADPALAEQEIKAGLLYNFLKYTQWPQAAMAKTPHMTLCIFGGDPFGAYLQSMEERTVNQRDIVLHDVQELQDMEMCHLLVIPAAQAKLWPKLHAALAHSHILTVSDLRNFTASGGMIQFGRRNNRIHVELNMDAATAAGLVIHDQLLKLVTVTPAAPEESR